MAVGDVDGDGLLDLFVTNPLMAAEDRNVLYRNLGDFRFERVPLPALAAVNADPATYGVTGMAVFADYDNDTDLDLFLAVGYGRNVLLRNRLAETGRLEFEDVSAAAGIDDHAVSIAASFLDYDRDGRLDLVVGNAFATHLDALPAAAAVLDSSGCRRPSIPATGGCSASCTTAGTTPATAGSTRSTATSATGAFERQDVAALGMPETHWSLAIGTGDLNHDGWTDLYVANDFGPDDLYLNEAGRGFRRIPGRAFGDIGRDTYKGMNASLGDFDRNGWLDVYVSNVHHVRCRPRAACCG